MWELGQRDLSFDHYVFYFHGKGMVNDPCNQTLANILLTDYVVMDWKYISLSGSKVIRKCKQRAIPWQTRAQFGSILCGLEDLIWLQLSKKPSFVKIAITTSGGLAESNRTRLSAVALACQETLVVLVAPMDFRYAAEIVIALWGIFVSLLICERDVLTRTALGFGQDIIQLCIYFKTKLFLYEFVY